MLGANMRGDMGTDFVLRAFDIEMGVVFGNNAAQVTVLWQSKNAAGIFLVGPEMRVAEIMCVECEDQKFLGRIARCKRVKRDKG